MCSHTIDNGLSEGENADINKEFIIVPKMNLRNFQAMKKICVFPPFRGLFLGAFSKTSLDIREVHLSS